MSKSLVVIGSGLAGYLFIKEFRQRNKNRPITLITMTDGRFYSKPQLSTALTHQKNIVELMISDAETMQRQLSINMLTHQQVISIDAKEKIIHFHSGKTISYEELVIACGAEKQFPLLQGNGVEDVHSVNTIEDYEVFRDWIVGKKHIAILGSGLVGCEFSNDLVNQRYQVTVISTDNYPLARWLPERAGQFLEKTLEKQGVKWVFGHSVKRIDKHNNDYLLTLDQQSSLHCDGVLSAIGIKPKLDLAKTAPLNTNRGIIIDSQLRTSDPSIYALGDCVEFEGECRQYVAPLLQQARTLAQLFNGEAVYLKYPIMPIIVKTPACPVIFVLPSKMVKGEWHYSENNDSLKAEFKDIHGQLQGFIVMGEATREKQQLIQKMVI